MYEKSEFCLYTTVPSKRLHSEKDTVSLKDGVFIFSQWLGMPFVSLCFLTLVKVRVVLILYKTNIRTSTGQNYSKGINNIQRDSWFNQGSEI
jgi:hypothetical protein